MVAGAGCGLLVFIVLPALGAFMWLAGTATLPFKLVFGGLAGAFCVYATSLFLRDPSSVIRVRILPYFEREIGGIETFLTGTALARNCERLDALARELSCVPLSDFGFADDLSGEAVTWHDPAVALMTVDALKARLSLDEAELARDLNTLGRALARAAEKGARFCLVLRVGDGASGMEMDRRVGRSFDFPAGRIRLTLRSESVIAAFPESDNPS